MLPVTLYVSKWRNTLSVSEVLDCFEKSEPLSIRARLKKKDQRYWRPSGANTFDIKIVNIELLPESINNYRSYKLTGQLIGMNGEVGKFPKEFSWSPNDIEHKIEMFFTDDYHPMSLVYQEHLSL